MGRKGSLERLLKVCKLLEEGLKEWVEQASASATAGEIMIQSLSGV